MPVAALQHGSGQAGAGVEEQWGAAVLFPVQSCPCGRREITYSSVCGLVWLHQGSCWGERISLSAGSKYTDLTEGPVGTWGVHLWDKKLPSRAWCTPLSGEFGQGGCAWLDQVFHQGFPAGVLSCSAQAAREPLNKWGFPRWFPLGNRLRNGESCSWLLGHIPDLLWNTQRRAGRLRGGNSVTCSQGLLESPRLWEWDSGWPQHPQGMRQEPLQPIILSAILADAGLYLHNVRNVFKRVVPQSDAKMAKHMQTKHTPKDVAERSVAASFPLGWWNCSFMFMLFWEIYKYRKEKKTLITSQL